VTAAGTSTLSVPSREVQHAIAADHAVATSMFVGAMARSGHASLQSRPMATHPWQ
jgi:hypothetical protein